MTWPKRWLQILNLHCREASALTSQALDAPLALPERLALRGHLLVCGPCRRFQKHLLILRDLLRTEGRSMPPAKTANGDGLPPAAKHRIIATIRETLQDKGENENDPNPSGP